MLLSVSLVFWRLYVRYIDINKTVNTEYWLECLNFSSCHYQLIISLLGEATSTVLHNDLHPDLFSSG